MQYQGISRRTLLQAGGLDFTYPQGSFASRGAIVALGVELETLQLGAYLGAVAAVETTALRLRLAQAAANEAQHLSVLAGELRNRPIGISFPPALTIDRASTALDAYTA
jgi:hypothetical protein